MPCLFKRGAFGLIPRPKAALELTEFFVHAVSVVEPPRSDPLRVGPFRAPTPSRSAPSAAPTTADAHKVRIRGRRGSGASSPVDRRLEGRLDESFEGGDIDLPAERLAQVDDDRRRIALPVVVEGVAILLVVVGAL